MKNLDISNLIFFQHQQKKIMFIKNILKLLFIFSIINAALARGLKKRQTCNLSFLVINHF